MKIHQAPWGQPLKWISLLLVLLAAGTVIGASFLPQGLPVWSVHLSRWTLPVIVLACLPFMVIGYGITPDALLIRRLFWTTRLDRAGLKSAEVVPRAMNKSLRACGNGGVFSFTGWYWSKPLGFYWAFVTDQDRTVVLRFEKKTVLVSPGEPEDFVKELNR